MIPVLAARRVPRPRDFAANILYVGTGPILISRFLFSVRRDVVYYLSNSHAYNCLYFFCDSLDTAHTHTRILSVTPVLLPFESLNQELPVAFVGSFKLER